MPSLLKLAGWCPGFPADSNPRRLKAILGKLLGRLKSYGRQSNLGLKNSAFGSNTRPRHFQSHDREDLLLNPQITKVLNGLPYTDSLVSPYR